METDTTHILIVDDDRRLRELLEEYLAREGYDVSTAANAAEARKLVETEMFDLAVVDVMMPGESGIDLVTSWRETPPWPYPMPILMLTAQNEPENRIAGLEAGADDYLGKPFEPRELVLRLEKLLQRNNTVAAKTRNLHIVKFGEYILQLDTGDLRRNGEFINLSSSELELLTILARKLDAPVSREELSRELKGISERSVDVQVTRLRKRIEENPREPRYIMAQWGKGYILRSRTTGNG